MLLISFTSLILLYHVQSAPTSSDPSCVPSIVGPKISKCLFNLKDMMELSKNSKEFNEKQKQEFFANCDFFSTCKPAFECFKIENMEVAFQAVEVQCKSVKFVFEHFMDCDKKLTVKNSTCSQTYNPFPELQEKDIPALLKEGRKDSCEKKYGDNDCMLTEIKELCGQEDFEKFRKVQMEIAHAIRLCEYDSTS